MNSSRAPSVFSQVIHPVARRQAARRELNIAAADERADIGLVRRLVLAEPDITVRPEDLRVAELGREVGHELRHRAEHLLVIERLVPGPVGP